MAGIDHAFQTVRSLGGRLRFFRKGFGPLSAHRHEDWLNHVRANALAPAEINVVWRALGVPDISVGQFESPSAAWLPPESRCARVLYVGPNQSRQECRPPVVLQLAATGDHGFVRRILTLAWWLRRRGIASLILENPFYGKRRPPAQRGSRLECVNHLADLGRATIEEGSALLSHFHQRGHARLAVTGVSQGGLHAAMTAALSPIPVPVVMAFAPSSAAPVFTEGVLARSVDWDALKATQSGYSGDVDEAHPDESEARVFLRSSLDELSNISNFPPQSTPARHVLIFAKSDG